MELTEKILSELVLRIENHFNLDPMDALEAVALSKIGNRIAQGEYDHRLTLDQLAEELYREVATAR